MKLEWPSDALSRVPWRKTPIFGALLICRLRDHAEALREFAVSIFFGFLPVLLALFIAWMGNQEGGAVQRLQQFAAEGELMIISVALIAPLCYLLPKTFGADGNRQAFPHRYAFILLLFSVLVATCVVYSAKESGTLSHADENGNSPVTAASYIITAISVGAIYLCLVYRNSVEGSVTKFLRDEDDRFADRWREHNE